MLKAVMLKTVMLKTVMLKTNKQGDIELLLEEIGALDASAPPQARRLRELLSELRADTEKLKSRWSPLGSAATASQLRARLDPLARIVGEIGALVRDAGELAAETDELRARSHQLDDLEISRFIHQRADGWSGRLAKMAAEAEPGWDPAAEQDFLDDTEEELRRTFQALYWLAQLEEAEGLFERLPDGAARARDELREKLFTGGADDSWLSAVRDQLDRVKEEARHEKARPLEIRTVGELTPLLHRWAGELGLLRDEVRDLDRRHKKIVVEDWATSLPREMLSEAQRLISTLNQRAREIRDENRRCLRAHMLELFQACGEQPVLDEGLTRLDGGEVTRPEEHRRWLRDSTRLRERMGAIANTHRAELDQCLTGRLEELRTALAELTSEPLTDEVLGLARQAEADAVQLAEPEKVDQALRALGEARDLRGQVAELRHRARAEAEALRTAQVDLRRENRDLLDEAARVGLEVPDLSDRIEDLVAVESLEDCKKAADQLGEELSTQRGNLVDYCRARLAEDLRGVMELLAALRQVDAAAAPSELPSVPQGAAPAAATTALLAGGELVRALEDRARVVAEHLDERRRQGLDDLQRLDVESLGPSERDATRRLVEELGPGFRQADPELLSQPESLRRLGLLVEKVELFQSQIEDEQRAVVDRGDALRRRLEAFLEDNLRELRAWHTDRVAALIYGLPDPPVATPDVHHQLDLAEDLLAKLEFEARRLAAHRLDQDVRLLEEKLRDPNFPGAAGAAALLEELSRHGRRVLPPGVLRLKITRAVK